MGYQYITEETSNALMEAFPKLTQAELDEANNKFQAYLFYETVPEGRKVWTSCCHVDGRLYAYLAQAETPHDREILALDHNEKMDCPYCGRRLTVKNRKQAGKCKRLEEFVPILFLHTSEDGATVYAQGYWAHKSYTKDPAAYPLYMPTNVYRFQHGAAIQWERKQGSEPWMMIPTGKEWITEPFAEGDGFMWKYCSYHALGLESLNRSFLRYVGHGSGLTKEESDLWSYTRKRSNLIRFLALAGRYPENVEMLLKTGLDGLVRDYIYRRKKNVDIITWGAVDPRKGFGLDSRELKAFLAGDKNLEVLRIYKKARRWDETASWEDAATLQTDLDADLTKRVLAAAKKLKAPLRKVFRYLSGMTGPRCHGGGVTLDFVSRYWCDYVDAAGILGYDLKNPLIQMPRDLQQAHDNAARAVEAVHAEMGLTTANDRYFKAQLRYGFESERYFIRAPFNSKEIVAEGKALKHCVAGYADRHAKGTVSILFLRDRLRPDAPLATIEMWGARLQQVHGYRNEIDACPENPSKAPARKLYAEILDPWLEWVKAGSKRDKSGAPKLPGKKKKETAA